MYKIIGGDGKEYGPVSVDMLRQWIIEGRLNRDSMVLPDGAAAWTPLGSLPEFADLLGAPPQPQPQPPGAPPVFPTGPSGYYSQGPTLSEEEILRSDYTIDIGECISRGWNLVKNNFGPMVGTTFLVVLAQGACNQAVGLLAHSSSQRVTADLMQNRLPAAGDAMLIMMVSLIGSPIYAIFFGGFYAYLLKYMRGQDASLADAFSGFGPKAGQLALGGLVVNLLTWLGFLLCVLPCIYLAIAYVFTIPLIMDRDMQFWDAMELSRKMVTKHWFLVFASTIVFGLVGVSGVIACCVGVLFTMPVGIMAILYAYESIFSRQAH